MIRALLRFVAALRRDGVVVSPSEVIEAARALQWVDPADRGQLRAALASTLAKSRDDRVVFDAAFDAFFQAPPRAPGKRRRKRGPGGAGAAERGGRSPSGAGTGQGQRHGGDPRGAVRHRSDREPRRAPETTRRRNVRRLLQQAAAAGAPRRGPRLVLSSGTPTKHEAPTTGGRGRPSGRARFRPVRDSLDPGDQARAEAVARELVRLETRRSRRLRRAWRGVVAPRLVFRESLKSGGVPFVLPRRRRLRRRTDLVLLVDVSYSTAHAAAYFLWLASVVARDARTTRVVAFVDRPVDVSRTVRDWWSGRLRAPGVAEPRPQAFRTRPRPLPGGSVAPASVPFQALMDAHRELDPGAPSDYGRVFYELLRSSRRSWRSGTVLVVLGDARTNQFDPQAWAFEELAARCRRVVWLVPEPAEQWGTGDSALGQYAPWVDVLAEAGDLEDLGRGIAYARRALA